MKKVIRIFFTDFWEDFNINNNFITDILSNYYTLDITAHNPDYLFYSCFSKVNINYSCIKIFYTGENITPDFNLCDYACGFDHINFDDRYFRLPLYQLCTNTEKFSLPKPPQKTKFCNFLYSNGRNAASERELFFNMLSQYKKVDSGGSFLNNIGDKVDDKKTWQKDYKFSIAFENSYKRGYTTEKILEALQSDTIPIYWGNPCVHKDFNTKRFVNCHDYTSFAEVIAKVKELDQDSEQYQLMLAEPWFTGVPPALPQDDPNFISFLRNIIEQSPQQARRTTPNGYTYLYLVDQKMASIAAVPFVKMKLRWDGMLRKLREYKQCR